jgi:hypothetical protein
MMRKTYYFTRPKGTAIFHRHGEPVGSDFPETERYVLKYLQ